MASARQKQSQVKAWLRAHYETYLEVKGTDGGFCDDWVTRLLRDAQADPETAGLNEAALEFLAEAARGLWHRDPAPTQLSLFAVAGVEIAPTYTFMDPSVPGNFRRVSGRYAAVRHVVADALVKRGNAERASAAADMAASDAAKIMAKAASDPDALLYDHRDYSASDASSSPSVGYAAK